jgi:hypothetical protein
MLVPFNSFNEDYHMMTIDTTARIFKQIIVVQNNLRQINKYK